MRHDRWTLLECPLCEVVFLDAPPTHAELSAESRWSASYELERESRRRRRPVLSAISRTLRPIVQFLRPQKATNLLRSMLPHGGTVVDVGCGDGARLDGLPKSFTPLGIEIDPAAAAIAEAKFASRGGRVLLGAATAQLASLKPRSLDAALLMAYLEHETRPIQALRLLRAALKPGAPVVIKVPNHQSWNRLVRGPQWCGYRFPDHVTYFSPSSLKRTLRHAGYRIVRFGPLDRLPTSDNMWMVAQA
jgi:SAM-dependent methyltransferase